MAGLFGNLTLATKALQAQQAAIQVSSRNIANINNPDYARQRVIMGDRYVNQTPHGPEGTGVEVLQVQQMRDSFLDGQVVSQAFSTGALNSQSQVLTNAQLVLGDRINPTTGSSITDTTSSTGGVGAALDAFFSKFSSLAAQPSDVPTRSVALQSAATLADRITTIDQGLVALKNSQENQIAADLSTADGLLSDIARLNGEILQADSLQAGGASDLIDQRQAKLEKLASLVKVDLSPSPKNPIEVNISLGGQVLVSDAQKIGTLSYTSGANVLPSISVLSGGSGYTSGASVTISGGGGYGASATATVVNGSVTKVNLNKAGVVVDYTSTPTVAVSGTGGSGAVAQVDAAQGVFSVNGVDVTASVTGGSVAGRFAGITGTVDPLREQLRQLTRQLVTSTTQSFTDGNGNTTTQALFTYDDTLQTGAVNYGARTLSVSSSISVNNLSTLGSTNAGDNTYALAVANLATKAFSTSKASPDSITGKMGDFSRMMLTSVGHNLQAVNTRLDEANVVDTAIRNQRDSVSAVNLDEETADLLKFQKAYQANAKVISVLSDMLDSVLQLIR